MADYHKLMKLGRKGGGNRGEGGGEREEGSVSEKKERRGNSIPFLCFFNR